MNKIIWNGVGQIGDDLIAGADENTVRNHFKRKKRNYLIKYTGLAACVCLVACLCIPLIRNTVPDGNDMAGTLEDGTYIIEPGLKDGELSFPGQGTLAYRLVIDKRIFDLSEIVTVKLIYGLNNDYLGNGTLKIRVDTGDFTTTAQTEITVADFTYSAHAGSDANTISIPLIPPQKDSVGAIRISFLFYPDDPEAVEYADFLSDCALPVGTISISYVINANEVFFSEENAADLFENRLVKMYETGTIGEKEFADRYFAFAYCDTVCASVENIKTDGSYSFSYRSKNIRYESPFITDPTIKDAMDAQDESLIVKPALEQMHKSGIITQEEYENELAWVAEARYAGMNDIGFDQNVAKYAHTILQKNMNTHS